MASRFLGLDDIYADTNPIEDVRRAVAAQPAPGHAFCPVDAYVLMLKHPSLQRFTDAQIDERIRDLLTNTEWPADVQAALLDEWRTTGKMGGVMVHVSSEEGVSLELTPETRIVPRMSISVDGRQVGEAENVLVTAKQEGSSDE